MLHADRKHRRRLSITACQFVTGPVYDWAAIAEQWCALLDKVLHGPASTGLAGRTGQA